MSAPPPLTRPKSKIAVGENAIVIAPPRRVPPPPSTAAVVERSIPAPPISVIQSVGPRAISPPSSFAVVRTVSPPQAATVSKAPATRPVAPTSRRGPQAAVTVQPTEISGDTQMHDPPPVSLVVSPAEIVITQLIRPSTDDVMTLQHHNTFQLERDNELSQVATTAPLPAITMTGSPGGEAMWREDSISDEDFDLPVAVRGAPPEEVVAVRQPSPVIVSRDEPLVQFSAPVAQTRAASLMIVDDDDDDINFSAPAPPPPPAAAQIPASVTLSPAATPISKARTPTQQSSSLVPETPLALRELLRTAPTALPSTEQSAAPPPVVLATTKGNQSSPSAPLERPEMDFSIEPFDYWYQQEEKKREDDRVKAQGRRTTVSIEETIKRLSKPKSSQRDDLSKNQQQPPSDLVEAASQPQTLISTASVTAGWNLPSSDRPNETHFYVTVRVFDATYHLALPKKATCGVICESLSLQEIGVLANKRGALMRWFDGISENRSPGLAGLSVLHVVSFVELDEETAREQVHADFMSSVAHFLAFSEWVLRCSNRISRHIFFDATDIFEDACTV
ncbi:Hypothetical protein, putative [Bodo saltans]|uniref:Uncharacterized protein n=1 Tax=Bodo saltans TaxID=75058 RepID=A0A0S4IHA8_BODSA|nr:Hypothetical protein, putative [Bodo saltans]|eukprot:CUE63119.1 Hypothetical protein, putative [Bodo saltans]